VVRAEVEEFRVHAFRATSLHISVNGARFYRKCTMVRTAAPLVGSYSTLYVLQQHYTCAHAISRSHSVETIYFWQKFNEVNKLYRQGPLWESNIPSAIKDFKFFYSKRHYNFCKHAISNIARLDLLCISYLSRPYNSSRSLLPSWFNHPRYIGKEHKLWGFPLRYFPHLLSIPPFSPLILPNTVVKHPACINILILVILIYI
jgi:hypothetical protein